MAEKTMLVLPGKRLSVPRVFKRILQVTVSVALTAIVALGLVIGSGLLLAKSTPVQGMNVWLTFINRTDILATMILTAIVTVLFVYWQRDQERKSPR